MLRRQHRRRRQEGDLLAVHHRLERGAHRHFGLAVADVAAQQAIHRRRRFHVALDVGDRGRLVRREIELERVLEFLLPVRVGAEGVTGHGLARGVELEQLLGHVAHRLLDLGLRLLPGRAAEPIERRLRSAGVFLDQIEALDGHEQLGVAVIAELEELLHDVAAGDGDLLEADELADAVIDVDDQIVDLEIAQVGEEGGASRSLLAARRSCGALRRRCRSRRRPAEPGACGLAARLRALTGLGDETLRQPALGDHHGAADHIAGVRRHHRANVVVLQQFNGALGAAVRAGDEDDVIAVRLRGLDVVDPVGNAAVESRRRLN